MLLKENTLCRALLCCSSRAVRGSRDYNLTRGLPWCLRWILCHPQGKPLMFGQATNLHSLFLKTSFREAQCHISTLENQEGSMATKTWAQRQPLL